MLARKYHPDVNKQKDAEKKFAEINEAYETLGDEQKRAFYDATGMTSNDQQNAEQRGDGQGFNPFGFGFGGRNKQDITSYEEVLKEFDEFFSMKDIKNVKKQSGARGGLVKGRDVQIDLQLTLHDLLDGCEREVEFSRNQNCKACNMTGQKAGGKNEQCPQCEGKGTETFGTDTSHKQVDCEACDGLGKIVEACLQCRGMGATMHKVKEKITIPKGCFEGLNLRLAGLGNQTIKGKSGDLMIKIRVEKLPNFDVIGRDVISSWRISMTQAIFGAKLQVKIPKGIQNINIPAGTTDGTEIKIKGQGLRKLHSDSDDQTGSHIVKLQIDIPQSLTDLQKRALKEYAAVEPQPENF